MKMELQYQDADRRRMSIQVASNASATDNAARKRSIINLAQETTSVATLVGATGSLKTPNDTSISSTQVPSGAGRRLVFCKGATVVQNRELSIRQDFSKAWR